MIDSIRTTTEMSGSSGLPNLYEAACLTVEDVLTRLRTVGIGLTSNEAARRLVLVGPNALRGHTVGPLGVMGRLLKNPFLLRSPRPP